MEISSCQLPVSCQYLVISSAAFLINETKTFIGLLELDDIWCVVL